MSKSEHQTDETTCVAIRWLLHDLTDECSVVEYERVIQAAHRDLLMERAEVEREVETLCDLGVVAKERGDFLRPVESPLATTG